MATLFFLVLEFLIGDSGTTAEWNENNKEMVSVVQEDGSTIQEEQVKPIPIHKAFADKFINRGIGGYLMGGWNNPCCSFGL